MNALIIGGSGGLSSVVAKMAMEKYRVWIVTRGLRPVPGVRTPSKTGFIMSASPTASGWRSRRKRSRFPVILKPIRNSAGIYATGSMICPS